MDATKSASRAAESMFIDFGLQVVGKLRRTRHHFAEEFLNVALQRGQFRVRLVFQIRLSFDARPDEGLQSDHFRHTDAFEAFEKRDYVSVGHAHHLVNFRESSHAVQVGADRNFHAWIELRYDPQKFLRTFQTIQQCQGAIAAHRQRHHRAREQDRITHRQDGELLRNNSIRFTHCVPLGLRVLISPFKQLIGC